MSREQPATRNGQPDRPPGAPRGGPLGALLRPAEKAKDFKGTLRRLLRYLQPRRGQLLAVLLLAVLSTVFGIVSPKILGQATTVLFAGYLQLLNHTPGGGVDFGAIYRIIRLLAGLYLLSALFGYGQQWLMATVAQQIVYEMRQEVNAKLDRLPLRYFDGRTHGEILSRVTNDVDNIASTLQQSITQVLTALVTLVGVVVMMLTISPLLTLVILVTLPLSLLVTKWIASRSQQYYVKQQKELGELNGHVEEMFTGHQVVKAFGREQASIEQFDAINQRLYTVAWRAQFMSGIIMPLMNFISNLGYVLVAVGGALLVIRQSLAIGDVQAFIQYSRQFSQPITQTANSANIIQSTVASAERVFELLDEEEELPDPPEAVEIGAVRGEIRFHRVQFGYRPETPLIEELSIEVRPGQTVAIVGPTGAGKTTLVNLLMRFYEIGGGFITIDGTDIRQVRRGALRGVFGMVLQDTWLFNGTIRENIAYGREGASEEDIERAAQAASADHFIRTLPEGYQTVLNEEASNLSQGQRQLLTIARAILADPAVLILDEATSSVDTRTELLIQQAMAELMKGRTSFVIAHRLSTIREADLILVMNNGRIIEQGRHTELLARGGFYAELYHSQFGGAPAAAVD